MHPIPFSLGEGSHVRLLRGRQPNLGPRRCHDYSTMVFRPYLPATRRVERGHMQNHLNGENNHTHTALPNHLGSARGGFDCEGVYHGSAPLLGWKSNANRSRECGRVGGGVSGRNGQGFHLMIVPWESCDHGRLSILRAFLLSRISNLQSVLATLVWPRLGFDFRPISFGAVHWMKKMRASLPSCGGGYGKVNGRVCVESLELNAQGNSILLVYGARYWATLSGLNPILFSVAWPKCQKVLPL